MKTSKFEISVRVRTRQKHGILKLEIRPKNVEFRRRNPLVRTP